MRKKLLLFVLMAGIVSVSLSGCNKADTGESVEEEAPLPVDTISAEKGTLVISETFMGSVSAEQELKIFPKAVGQVISINVKPGDFVNAGDVLFQLDDEAAQLDLKSAKTSLSKTQAQVKKSEGSDTVLAQQKEWQSLENQNSRIADSKYSLGSAQDDYYRQLQYLDESKGRENDANEDYKKADKKYDKAKSILNDYEKLQKKEATFANKSLKQAAETPVGPPPTQENVDEAKRLWNKAQDGDDSKLTDAEISTEGVASLKTKRDSAYNTYEQLKISREGQEDKVTSAKRAVDKADKSLQDNYTSYRQSVDNMMINDISVLEDNKRLNQIDINSSSLGVEKAQYSLDQYTVVSPISGVVGKVGIKEYEMVATSTEAVLIENNDSMKVEFSVTEKVRGNLTVGQSITVEKEDGKIAGHITEIPEVPDEKNGMFTIKAQIPGSSGILSGTRVSVTLDSYKDEGGYVIPYDAVYHANGKTYVYIAVNGQVVRRDVVTGMFDADRIVITEGLSDGDRVITSWSSDLKEGKKIQENLTDTPVVKVDEPEKDAAMPVAEEVPEEAKPEEEPKQEEPKSWTMRATTTVYIRSTPDKDSNDNKLGKANKGDEFTAVDANNGWTKVKYNDSEAYIKSDYLTEVAESGEAQ